MEVETPVLHTVASLKASSGGTSQSVPALCESLGAAGCGVTLVSQSARWPASPDRIPDARFTETRFVPGLSLPALRLSYAPGFAREVLRMCRQRRVELVHTHGLWTTVNHASAGAARSAGLPLVVSPRGMLEDWALAYRGWKKRVAWRVYQEADLRGARAFCASSAQEAGQLRKLGFGQPVAVIPNGVELPDGDCARPAGRGVRTALFLSRIHPKKGLLDLVQAWAAVRPSGWRLVIAGPDEDGHAQIVRAAVAKASLQGVVEFRGEVRGEDKRAVWREADLFVLPTHSENFGIVVAEALAWGLPVITTRGAPWADLVDRSCGWWTPPGPEGLGAALAAAVALTDAERTAMGANGRSLVREKFAWDRIARDTIAFYRWLLHGGERPGHVLAEA